MQLTIHTDGGARGNPGPAAIGVVIDGIVSFGKTIGETTNNVAEYTAVIEALAYIVEKKLHVDHIHFFLDSTLVVNQMAGRYKVKQPHLQILLERARGLIQKIGCRVTYESIPREKNILADNLVNQALDAR